MKKTIFMLVVALLIAIPAAAQTVSYQWAFQGYAVGKDASGAAVSNYNLTMSDIVRLPDGTFRMYYDALLDPPDPSGATSAIDSATSADDITWTVEPGHRLLGAPNTQRAVVKGPRVVQMSNGTYRMYYQADSGAGPEAGAPDFRVMYATSGTDGLAFTHQGTVIDIGGQFTNTGHCAVIRFSDTDWVIFVSANYGTPISQPSDLVIGTSTDGLTFSNFSILYPQGHDPFVVNLLDGSGYVLFYGNMLERQRSAFSADGKAWPAQDQTTETVLYDASGVEVTEASGTGPGDRSALELADGEILLFLNWRAAATTGDIALMRMYPGAFTLSSPANGAAGETTTPTLAWENAAAEIGYTIQISTDAAFATMVYENGTVAADATSHTVPAGNLSAGTTYYWRAIAENAQGQTTASNAPFSFSTAGASGGGTGGCALCGTAGATGAGGGISLFAMAGLVLLRRIRKAIRN